MTCDRCHEELDVAFWPDGLGICLCRRCYLKMMLSPEAYKASIEEYAESIADIFDDYYGEPEDDQYSLQDEYALEKWRGEF